MSQNQPTKTKSTKGTYRNSVGFEPHIAERIIADATRKGIGVADVIRIAVSEYIERLPSANTN